MVGELKFVAGDFLKSSSQCLLKLPNFNAGDALVSRSSIPHRLFASIRGCSDLLLSMLQPFHYLEDESHNRRAESGRFPSTFRSRRLGEFSVSALPRWQCSLRDSGCPSSEQASTQLLYLLKWSTERSGRTHEECIVRYLRSGRGGSIFTNLTVHQKLYRLRNFPNVLFSFQAAVNYAPRSST
jgi:hypothetical protein